MDKYVPRRKVLDTLGIHFNTLQNMVKRGDIEYIKIGSKNRGYNLSKYIRDNNILIEGKENICYCRVSSKKQKEDLDRQIEYMEKKYPKYRIVSDVCSGLKMNRKGLNEIIDLAIKGKINYVAVAHKDRLARFGYDMIKNIIQKYSNGQIIVDDKNIETPHEEITKDIISIMNVFVAKINGLRKYKKKAKKQ